MRKLLLAAAATVALSAPFAASADGVTVRDKPNGSVVIRDHSGPPGPAGDVVVREHPNGSAVIRDHVYDRAARPTPLSASMSDREATL